MKEMRDFCFRLPKCELHAHLNGSISSETIRQLAKQRMATDPQFSGLSDEDSSILSMRKLPNRIEEAFKIFPLVQRLTERKEELILATESVIADFAAENVVYLELRTTPKSTKWMSKRDYVETIIATIKRVARLCPTIIVRLLLSVDRRQTLEDARQTIDMALELFSSSDSIVVGVELSGDPRFDATKFLPLFRQAAEHCLPFTLHIAELSSHLDELEECLLSRPDRIGHGTFIHNNRNTRQKTVCTELVIGNNIPLEVCLTSNVLCGTTSSFEASHLSYYLSRNHPVALCTDDRGIMDCTLSGEFWAAAKAFRLSKQDLLNLSFAAFQAAFIHRKSGCSNEISLVKRKLEQFAAAEGLLLKA